MINRKTHKNIEGRFNKMINFNIAVEVAIIIFGIIMLFSPDITNKLIGTLIGALFLLVSFNMLYNYFLRNGAKLYSMNLVFGLILALLGGILIIYPYSFIEFVTVCIGIYCFISGAFKINQALWLKKAEEDSWFMLLINSIFIIILGLLLLFNPFANLAVTQVLGVFLIITSTLKIASAVLFKKRAKEITKIFW